MIAYVAGACVCCSGVAAFSAAAHRDLAPFFWLKYGWPQYYLLNMKKKRMLNKVFRLKGTQKKGILCGFFWPKEREEGQTV